MPGYVPPAAQAEVAPSSPAQGVYIGSADQLGFEVLIGKKLFGGVRFLDTLGGFYPIVIDPASYRGLVVSGSDSQVQGLVFHNTAVVLTDEVIYFGNSGALFIVPNSTASVNTPLVIADRAASAYFGWLLYPNSGLTPSSYATFSGGVGTLVWYNGVFHGYQFLTDYYANQVLVSGNTAGNQPGFQAQGSDTNIDIQVIPKGTGLFLYNYAATALGGGAAPTLGTIGGSGPATAVQNAWLAVKIAGQTTYWIPVWR